MKNNFQMKTVVLAFIIIIFFFVIRKLPYRKWKLLLLWTIYLKNFSVWVYLRQFYRYNNHQNKQIKKIIQNKIWADKWT